MRRASSISVHCSVEMRSPQEGAERPAKAMPRDTLVTTTPTVFLNEKVAQLSLEELCGLLTSYLSLHWIAFEAVYLLRLLLKYHESIASKLLLLALRFQRKPDCTP